MLNLDNLKSSQADSHAKTSQSLEIALDWLGKEADCSGNSFESLKIRLQNGLSWKMSLDYCHQEDDGTLVPSSGRWFNAGMASPTGCLTLNISESPNVAVESLLSDILEENTERLQGYYLSQKACRGLLNRAERRGRALPTLLKKALEQTASRMPSPQDTEEAAE